MQGSSGSMLTLAEQLFAVYNVTHDVQRFHAKPTIKPQNLAAHQWGVAWLIVRLHPNPSLTLIRTALEHDAAEGWTGDMPYGVKRRYPRLKEELGFVEEDICDEFNTSRVEALCEEDQKWLKYCDMIELILYCIREMRLGNVSMKHIVDFQVDKYINNKDVPQPLRDLVTEAVKWVPGGEKEGQQYAY